MLVGGFGGFLKIFLSLSAAFDFDSEAFLAAEKRFLMSLAFACLFASLRVAVLSGDRVNSTTLPGGAFLLSSLKGLPTRILPGR